MKTLILGAVLILSSLNLSAETARDISTYNLNNTGQGFIDGEDPNKAKAFDIISVYPEGGSAVKLGLNTFKTQYKGVEYLFSSQKNLDLFLTNPKKFEPTYGGWCARAMAAGQYIHIDTSLYTEYNGRYFFFVSNRAKRSFDRSKEQMIKNADANWKRISGEDPRF